MKGRKDTRRGFLGLLAGTAAGTLLGSLHSHATPWTGSAAACAVGEAYLRAYPETNYESLAGRLEGLRPGAALAARIRDDFRRGGVVVVEGWVLSRTEASLCALVALAQS